MVNSIYTHRDPKIIGPGTWAVMHSTTRNCTRKDFKRLIQMIKDIVENFGCVNPCGKNAKQHIYHDDPIDNVLKEKDDLALFRYTVKFHNVANKHSGKGQMDYMEALYLWSDETKCSKKTEKKVEQIMESKKKIMLP